MSSLLWQPNRQAEAVQQEAKAPLVPDIGRKFVQLPHSGRSCGSMPKRSYTDTTPVPLCSRTCSPGNLQQGAWQMQAARPQEQAQLQA
jgi:hypothetical protein